MNRDAYRAEMNPAQAGGASAPLRFPSPPAIPHHTLLRRIGSGSYGEVWLARNSIGTFRAVKIVYRSCFNERTPFERELSGIRKFEPISRSHEGFVDVLQVDLGLEKEDAEYFFYVMEIGDDCLDGQAFDLEKYIPRTLAGDISSRGKLPLAECLDLALKLTRALAALHKHDLVHRDVKPSNIIFVDGVPKLADIGLVADINDARSYVGTEGFIPPEGPGTRQADLYSLGKVLYEACTGWNRNKFPGMPHSLVAKADQALLLELNAVILRACAPSLANRYKSVEEMHQDLVVLANGKSVRRLRQLELRLSRIRRIGLALAASVGIASAIGFPWYKTILEREQAKQRQIGSAIAYGNRSLDTGDLLGSLPYFSDALRLHHASKEDETADRLRLGMILAQCPKLTAVWRAPSEINDAEFSPDGRRVVIACESDEAIVYPLPPDVRGTNALRQLERVETAIYSHDGKFILTASDDCVACLRDAKTFEVIRNFPHTNRVRSARFGPDDMRIVTACSDGRARVFNVGTGAMEQQVSHNARVRFAELSHDGTMIATASEDGTACIWDAKSGSLLQRLPHPGWVYHVSFSPDDKEVVTVCNDHKARVWEIIDGAQRFPVMVHADVVFTAEFSQDGRLILTACLDGTAQLWRRDTLQHVEINPILRLGEHVTHAAFAPDSRRILLGGANGAIEVWDLSGIAPPPARIACTLSGDGTRILVSTNGAAMIEDAATHSPLGPPLKIDHPISEVQLNANGHFAVIVDSGIKQRLQILEVSTGRQWTETLDFKFPAPSFVLSENGSNLAVFGSNVLEVVRTTGLSSVYFRQLLSNEITGAFFNSTGKELVVWAGNEIEVLNATNGDRCFPPLEFSQPVIHVELSPDEAQLLGSCWNDQWTPCYAQRWDFRTGKAIGPRMLQSDGVLWCTYRPDGLRVGTASEDYTAAVWDMRGAHITPLMRHGNKVETFKFSSDGKLGVTASRDCTARIWNPETGDPLSPPLRTLDKLTYATFLSTNRVLTISDGDVKRIWPLESDDRPVADVLDHVTLLTGGQGPTSGDPLSTNVWPAEILWEKLLIRYPSLFKSDLLEITRWHEFAVEESQTNGDSISAAFHLGQLKSLEHANRNPLARMPYAPKKTEK